MKRAAASGYGDQANFYWYSWFFRDGGDAIVALVDDLVAVPNGNDGLKQAKLATSLVRDVFDATLDLTRKKEDVEVARRRVLGVFLQSFEHCRPLVSSYRCLSLLWLLISR